jgi:hypothetical protein
VGDAFGLLDFGPLRRECACVRLGGTESVAVGTGLFGGESLGLLLEEQLECYFGEPLRGGGGDLLEGAEVDIETRSVIAECPLGNDLGPLSRKVVEFLKFLGRESR